MNRQPEQIYRQPTFAHFRNWLAPPGRWIWRHPPKPPDKYHFKNEGQNLTTTNIKQEQQRSSTMTNKHFFRNGPLLGIIALALIWVTSAATPADALVAAGTSIDNEATVSYNEGGDVTSNIVSTTVNLVSGLAWDDASLTPATQTTGSLSVLSSSYTVDLVNLGNGATTAIVTDGTTESALALTTGAWTINGVASPSVLMGGTVSSAAAATAGANTNIPVSYVDLAALIAGDTVRIGGIGGNDYVVAAGSTAINLVVVGDATGDVGAAGVQIGEVSTITFTGTTGTLTGAVTQSHNHQMTANDETAPGSGVNSSGNASASDIVSDNGSGTTWQTFVQAGVLTINKYVRNVTTGNAGTGPAFPYDGNNYYQAGVTGDSTVDTLEYLIVISNAGPGNASNVTVTDDINSFLLLATTSVDIDADGDGSFAGASDVTDAVNNDAASIAGTVLTVYAGVGGTAAGTTGGVITAAAGSSAVRFQAAIQ